MVERSAAARAKAEGMSVEDVLRDWAGEEVAASPATAPEAGAAEAVTAAEPVAEEADGEEASGPAVEVLEPGEAPGGEPAEAPTEPEEPAPAPSRDPAGAPALAGFPAWLAAAFLVVPAIAILYAMLAPDGPGCGTSGQLAIDPATGVAVNCDGTEYGVEVVNFFSIGQVVYDARCASCHGANGGGGAGPALSGGSVLATFPQGACEGDTGHVAWVALGTASWPDPTYGVTARPVGGVGVMPGFGETLSEEELASVVVYERVAFGGQLLPEAEEDCGLLEEELTAAP